MVEMDPEGSARSWCMGEKDDDDHRRQRDDQDGGSQGDETLPIVYHGQREERDNQDDSMEKRGRHYPWYTTGSEKGQ